MWDQLLSVVIGLGVMVVGFGLLWISDEMPEIFEGMASLLTGGVIAWLLGTTVRWVFGWGI
jgi:hypothetical protein